MATAPSTASDLQAERARSRRFRFDGIVIDEEAVRLTVDGRERPCSTRAFRLLSLLCEAPGRVLPRQDLLDRLWPGGQVVGDEALTQAVFRARACLGPYAERVVTVRGVGIRLDAEVARLDVDEAIAPVPSAHAPTHVLPREVVAAIPSVAPPVTDRSSAPRRHSLPVRPWLLPVLLAVAVAVVWLMTRTPPESPTTEGEVHIDRGYGLLGRDAHASRDDTIGLLAEAFRHEGRGDRARGSALLETLHNSDATTPLPAIFLALWATGGGHHESADRWLAAARPRVEAVNDPFITTIYEYSAAEREGSRQAVLRFAGAALDLRPHAWQMRLARTHMLMSEGYREAALGELAAIDFGALEHRKLVVALADRASLGDIEGAERELARISDTIPNDASLAYLRGRIAWSRGDFEASRQAYEDSARMGEREARFDMANRSQANAGLIALMQGADDQALRLLEQARARMAETGWVIDQIDLSLILAQLHAFRGDLAAASADLDRAERMVVGNGGINLNRATRLFRARLGGIASAPIQDDPDPALAALLTAHEALSASNIERALAAFADAERRLSPASMLHEELRWLAARLGQPVPPPQVVDPPYPPLARLATRAAVERLQTQAESAANP